MESKMDEIPKVEINEILNQCHFVQVYWKIYQTFKTHIRLDFGERQKNGLHLIEEMFGQTSNCKIFDPNSSQGKILKLIIFDTMLPYSILQFAKLHDNEGRGQNRKLVLLTCLNEIKKKVNHNEYDKMKGIHEELNEIYKANIKPTRDKIIAHLSLKTVREGTVFEIKDEKIDEYLNLLRELVGLIEKHSGCKGNFPDNDYKLEALDFVGCLDDEN